MITIWRQALGGLNDDFRTRCTGRKPCDLVGDGRAGSAQPYPNKPVKVVVSHAAGSSPDVVARLAANRLGQRLNQTFIIENKVGANGSLAVDAVSRSAPDGYSLLVAGSSIMATNPYLYPRTSAAIVTGLTPLTKLTNLDFLLAVRSSLNIRTFQELIAHVRANPGKLNLATTNTGSFQNLGAELLRQQADLDFKTIPYNGGAAAASAVAGGHVDMLIDASAVIAPLAQSGVLKLSLARVPRAILSCPMYRQSLSQGSLSTACSVGLAW